MIIIIPALFDDDLEVVNNTLKANKLRILYTYFRIFYEHLNFFF